MEKKLRLARNRQNIKSREGAWKSRFDAHVHCDKCAFYKAPDRFYFRD
jgi:hypothetical protein